MFKWWDNHIVSLAYSLYILKYSYYIKNIIDKTRIPLIMLKYLWNNIPLHLYYLDFKII